MSQCIYIVDDDAVVRNALTTLFMLEGFRVECFDSGAHFLSAVSLDPPACLILDLQMPQPSGIEVLHILHEQGYPAPVIITSDSSDIRTAVQAMKWGAFDFIEKPFDIDSFLKRVQEAISYGVAVKTRENSVVDFPVSTVLTPRERDVMKLITTGASNKEAGRQLGISPRTIEVHRARIMDKLGARNAADLVRIVLTLEQKRAS